MINTSKNINWHTSQWQQIAQFLEQDRFPHALLFEGIKGIGKRHFAFQLAQMLLCQGEPTDSGICQTCSSCEWFLSGTHPDFVILEPAEGKKLISVDAIRQNSQKVFKTSHQNGYKILIIEPADAMTVEAANSLLKTLEEPPEQTLLILLTDKPARLLPTIRSRASRLKFTLPMAEQALTWLQGQGHDASTAKRMLALSLGAPLRLQGDAEEISQVLLESQQWWKDWRAMLSRQMNPVVVAKQCAKAEPGLFLNWLETLFRALIETSAQAESNEKLPSAANYEVLFPGLNQVIQQFSLPSLFRMRDNVVELSQRQQSSLNWGLQLEALACDCYSST